MLQRTKMTVCLIVAFGIGYLTAFQFQTAPAGLRISSMVLAGWLLAGCAWFQMKLYAETNHPAHRIAIVYTCLFVLAMTGLTVYCLYLLARNM